MIQSAQFQRDWYTFNSILDRRTDLNAHFKRQYLLTYVSSSHAKSNKSDHKVTPVRNAFAIIRHEQDNHRQRFAADRVLLPLLGSVYRSSAPAYCARTCVTQAFQSKRFATLVFASWYVRPSREDAVEIQISYRQDTNQVATELRNVVYAYLFDDGKKANANFLLTCRQARWEAGLLFVRSVTFRTSLHSADRRALIQQDVPTSHRKAITSVHREKFVFDFWSMAFNCHAVGIFPTEASVDMDWHRCHDQGRRQLPHHFQNMLYLARNTETGQEGVECGPFGEWLDNPRLLRWRVRQIDEFGLCKWEIKGTRVDARAMLCLTNQKQTCRMRRR